MATEKQYREFTTEDAKNGRQPVYRDGEEPLQWFYLDKSVECKLISVLMNSGRRNNHKYLLTRFY